jgi:hypothetical protein
MNKISKNEKGFSIFEILLVIVFVFVVTFIGGQIAKHNTTSNSNRVSKAVLISKPSTSSWHSQTFNNGQYNFSDVFPCNPGVAKTSGTDRIGQYTGYGFVCKYENTGLVYIVLASIYNADKSAVLPPLALSQEQNVQDGQIVSTNKFQLDGNPAEAMQYTAITNGKKAYGSVEYVIKMSILYTVVTTSLENPNKDAQYFISSFKVVN